MVQLKYLLALAPFAALALADNESTSDNHSQDNSHSTTDINQGGYYGGCGMIMTRRGQTFGNMAGGGNVVGNVCQRSEHVEANNEARDIHHGFDALDVLTARDNTSTADDHSEDNSSSETIGNGGGYYAGCLRSHFDARAPIDQHFGNMGGSGNVAGNICGRSAQLAIRDVGGMYRRLQTRAFTEEQANEAEQMLRRHAEHLGLL